MSYQHLADGLYLVKIRSGGKGVDHYGILDVGNRLEHPQADGIHPILVHQTPPAVRLDWFDIVGGTWDVLGRIEDEPMAKNRMSSALKDPTYDLFGHNCEHFARFVATGKRESTQLQAVGIVAGLAALAIVAFG
ncbi:MAG: hypothetical protein ACYDBH_03665 [Acidobacteriaceae bacterium]